MDTWTGLVRKYDIIETPDMSFKSSVRLGEIEKTFYICKRVNHTNKVR